MEDENKKQGVIHFPANTTKEQGACVLSAQPNKIIADPTHPSHLIMGSNVQYESPKTLISPMIPMDALILVQGEPGVGKTSFICTFAAHVTTGNPICFIDGNGQQIKIESKGNVLLMSVEDDLSLLKGRFSAAGGDASKLFFADDACDISVSSQAGLNLLEAHITECNAQLVVLDPLQMFIGAGIDFHRANQTRPILAKLADMAKRLHCAIVLIAHTSKSAQEKSPVLRSLGSTDIPAACRSVIHIMKVEPDSDEIAAVQVKCNFAAKGPTIVYTIGTQGEAKWTRMTNDTVERLEGLAQAETILNKCKKAVLEILEAGKIKSTDLEAKLMEKNFKSKTIQRAKSDLRKTEKIDYSVEFEDDIKVTYIYVAKDSSSS